MSFENWNRFLTNTIAELNRDQVQRDHSKEPKHKGSNKSGCNKKKQNVSKSEQKTVHNT